MQKVCRTCRFLVAIGAFLALVAGGAVVEDEPDELSRERLGATLTAFSRFRAYCAAHPAFQRAVLACPAVDRLPEAADLVWITAEAFVTNAVIRDWHSGTVAGEACLCAGGGHLAGKCRIGVEIPSAGYYRLWARYYHDRGSVAPFSCELEDGRLATETDASLSVVQNAFLWRFDWAEHARKGPPLPTRKDEPTGWIMEGAPLVYLTAGRHTLTLSGLICGGPFAARRVSAIALTRDPLAVPERPAGRGLVRVVKRPLGAETKAARALFERRPLATADASPRLEPLWAKWQADYLRFLALGKAEGLEETRFASLVAFDPASNLIGTPKQIAEGKAEMRAEIARLDRTHFRKKIEAEDFTMGKSGWWVAEMNGSSGGRMLGNGYWGGEADAFTATTVPTSGVYNVWLRYMEIGGYLSRYTFRIENAAGTALATKELAGDAAFNKAHPGHQWLKFTLDLKETNLVFRVVKKEAGATYRWVDCVMISDDPAFVPEGMGRAVPPRVTARPLTVWRARDPWAGFDRLSSPRDDEGLAPYPVALREGEAEPILVLVRNNTAAPIDVVPRVTGRSAAAVSWRVVAFALAHWGEFTPQPLLVRNRLTVPPDETAGLWLTVTADDAFQSGRVAVQVGDETLALDCTRLAPFAAKVPVPYVFGWSVPFKTVSAWEAHRRLGINVIGDQLVPRAEAARYGMRLVVRLNDGNVSPEHVAALRERFARRGYAVEDWAWSFMDEPGNKAADAWVALAQKVRALDKDIRIWCNPGEIWGASGEACLKMTPYVNVYSPYADHYSSGGGGNAAYNAQLHRKGPASFAIQLGYSTPCFWEKGAAAPFELLGQYRFALDHGLDGWGFFALTHGFTYSNSVWDEVNAFVADQCMNLYPGAAYHTISTRNAEAVAEAVKRWRRAKAAALEKADAKMKGNGK